MKEVGFQLVPYCTGARTIYRVEKIRRRPRVSLACLPTVLCQEIAALLPVPDLFLQLSRVSRHWNRLVQAHRSGLNSQVLGRRRGLPAVSLLPGLHSLRLVSIPGFDANWMDWSRLKTLEFGAGALLRARPLPKIETKEADASPALKPAQTKPAQTKVVVDLLPILQVSLDLSPLVNLTRLDIAADNAHIQTLLLPSSVTSLSLPIHLFRMSQTHHGPGSIDWPPIVHLVLTSGQYAWMSTDEFDNLPPTLTTFEVRTDTVSGDLPILWPPTLQSFFCQARCLPALSCLWQFPVPMPGPPPRPDFVSSGLSVLTLCQPNNRVERLRIQTQMFAERRFVTIAELPIGDRSMDWFLLDILGSPAPVGQFPGQVTPDDEDSGSDSDFTLDDLP